MRRFARADDNQIQVVDDLRLMGFRVIITHQLGLGAPDLVVGGDAKTVMVELKKPGAKPTNKLDKVRFERQQQERETWPGGLWIQATTAEEIATHFRP